MCETTENQRFVVPCKSPRSENGGARSVTFTPHRRMAGVYDANITTHSRSKKQGNALDLQNPCKFRELHFTAPSG
jgi:hypothetical protein